MSYAPYFPYEPATVDYLTHISDERRYFYFSNPNLIGLIYADDFNTFGYGYDPAFAHV